MSEPGNSGYLARPHGWVAERSVFVASVVALVGGAAYSGHTVGWAVLVVASWVCFGMAVWAWHKKDVSSAEVLAFAVMARIIALPLLPGLSDDGFRYVWDGWLQANGFNPFLYLPSDTALRSFQETDIYERLNSRNYYSVYPPSSQLAFWVGGIVSDQSWIASWYTIKGLFVVLEIWGVYLISRVVAPHLLVLYAWHPLAIIEGAGQGHTEIAMVGFLFVSLYAYREGRQVSSLAALTVAVWFKLYPIVFMPFVLKRVGWRYIWVPIVASVMLWIAFFEPIVVDNIVTSLNLYTMLFEFNSGPYYLLKQIGKVVSGADIGKQLGPLLQYGFLITVALIYAFDWRNNQRLPILWFTTIAIFWVTATTIHPWYLLSVIALIPLIMSVKPEKNYLLISGAWLWLSLLSMTTYSLYTIGETPYWIAIYFGWIGWALLLSVATVRIGLTSVMRRRASAKWNWVAGHIQTSDRLLDLGAGEGFVGAEAARELNAEVILADVVDFNQTELPFVGYNGRHLPFSEDAFDATMLLFVLHHTENPSIVLCEAHRVTRGRVIVVESVIENDVDIKWLSIADKLANRIRSGGKMQEQVLNFDTTVGWRSRFAEAGFEIVAEERRGRWIHKQHLFVLE